MVATEQVGPIHKVGGEGMKACDGSGKDGHWAASIIRNGGVHAAWIEELASLSWAELRALEWDCMYGHGETHLLWLQTIWQSSVSGRNGRPEERE
jgi:hypothetical protein